MSQLSIRRITRPSFLLELIEGSPVGEYEIQAQIGEGAMGTVYSAVHPLIGKKVAVKVLKPELCANQASLDRFLHEAQAVNKIGHPNIVDVFSFNELADGRVYFVMEWLRGEDLKTRLARGPISVPDACDILDGVARALEAAHAKQIIQRDLKPDNIFLHQVDNGPVMVKLLDFGIAKLVKVSPGTEKTQTGNMLGTPRYISPEQARGVNVDYRTDIYSLGVIAYEMLAGRPPFQGETAMDLVVQHMNERPPALGGFAKLPKPLEQTVMRMLEKDPQYRPTVEEVRGVLQDPQKRLTPMPIRAIPMAPRPRGRKWLAIGAAVVGAIALGAGTWWLVSRMKGDEDKLASIQLAAKTEPAPPPKVDPPPPPAPVPRATIEVHVSGGTGEATILVDDQEWGRGASIKVPVDPGKHVVTVRSGNRQKPITHEVDVAAGASASVDIVVPTVQTVRQPPVRTPPRKEPPKKEPTHGTGDDDLLPPKGSRK